jgi:hypothetical protein
MTRRLGRRGKTHFLRIDEERHISTWRDLSALPSRSTHPKRNAWR